MFLTIYGGCVLGLLYVLTIILIEDLICNELEVVLSSGKCSSSNRSSSRTMMIFLQELELDL